MIYDETTNTLQKIETQSVSEWPQPSSDMMENALICSHYRAYLRGCNRIELFERADDPHTFPSSLRPEHVGIASLLLMKSDDYPMKDAELEMGLKDQLKKVAETTKKAAEATAHGIEHAASAAAVSAKMAADATVAGAKRAADAMVHATHEIAERVSHSRSSSPAPSDTSSRSTEGSVLPFSERRDTTQMKETVKEMASLLKENSDYSRNADRSTINQTKNMLQTQIQSGYIDLPFKETMPADFTLSLDVPQARNLSAIKVLFPLAAMDVKNLLTKPFPRLETLHCRVVDDQRDVIQALTAYNNEVHWPMLKNLVVIESGSGNYTARMSTQHQVLGRLLQQAQKSPLEKLAIRLNCQSLATDCYPLLGNLVMSKTTRDTTVCIRFAPAKQMDQGADIDTLNAWIKVLQRIFPQGAQFHLDISKHEKYTINTNQTITPFRENIYSFWLTFLDKTKKSVTKILTSNKTLEQCAIVTDKQQKRPCPPEWMQ